MYLGTDKAAVEGATPASTGIYKRRQADTAYSLTEPLLWKQTYYWRIDEINVDSTVAKGKLWSFKVADYLMVDTFESHTNDSPNRVFQTWIVGVGDRDNPQVDGAGLVYIDDIRVIKVAGQ